MKKEIGSFWSDLPLFWKTFLLSLSLAASVVLIGEGSEDLAKKLIRYAELPVGSKLREALIWLAAIVISSLSGSIVISRIITGALTRVQPVVEQLARGDLSSRIEGPDLERGDEIGRLGRSFNRMADSLCALLDNERLLIRDISHEMRSPLARMKIALALLEQDSGGFSAQADEPFKQLEKDLDRLETMIGQMLERARQEGLNQTGLEKAAMDLARLAADSVEELAFNGAGENKRLVLEGPAAAPYIGNEPLLRRALDNLIRNALHYTAADSTVTVRLRPVPTALIVEVIDQGPGVPEGDIENIFRPFYRVDSARTRKSGGFGLGLAIAQQAVQLHGGRLTAVNLPTEAEGWPGGLKVTMTLPLNLKTPEAPNAG